MDMSSYDDIHEIQTAPTLVAVPIQCETESQIGIYEFVSKSFAQCPINTIHWLSYFKQPKTLFDALRDHQNVPSDVVRSEVASLIDARFLRYHNSRIAGDDSYGLHWEWDISTALYHFTVQDNPFMSDYDAKEAQLGKLKASPPPIFWWAPKFSEQKCVSEFVSRSDNNLLGVMRRRRTNRTSRNVQLEISKVSLCLFAGLGIVGTIKATSGDVPLAMTPSGGARHPYEAYMVVRRCNGLCPGVYHYCAADQVLEKISALDPETKLAGAFGDQDWLDEMAVVVILVAVLERTMWKYQDPNAYRVMLIEAGHIGQNIMLMATEQGYTVCPTAAMSHSKVFDFLGLQNKLLHAPIYALSIDEAQPYQIPIEPLKCVKPIAPLASP